jgi:carboxyl-terminal processing protease
MLEITATMKYLEFCMPLRRRCAAAAASLALCLSSGLWAGPDSSDDDVRASLKKFTEVYRTVESNFADKVDADQVLYHGAIPSMLRTLDPHSSFWDPKAYEALREEQVGHYYGVGMYIWAPEGKVTVNYPFKGSPAFRAGIHPGDQIVSVNDKNTEKSEISEVSALLKGPRGTKASIVVRRPGNAELMFFNIVRDEVPRDSVKTSYWIKPGIAYLKIDSFNENTSKEVETHLSRLGENKMEGLILDLRGNPGGILQEAAAVADRFLHKGQVIVTHHGRASQEQKFFVRRGEHGPVYPIVVLVDHGSASAAEILSGALQDHDRAWILGENTFGKGLVQAPYPLTGNTALLLTIAKYYTPSGRLIQRDYAHRSFWDYYSRRPGKNNAQDAHQTDSGRVVYGGDGITPDEKYVTTKLTKLEAQLNGSLSFYFYTADYFGAHKEPLAKDWTPSDQVVDAYRAFTVKRGLTIDPEEFKKDRPWIAERLREEFFITAFSKDDSERLALDNDQEIRRGVEALPQSKALLEKTKEVVAHRQEAPAPVEP